MTLQSFGLGGGAARGLQGRRRQERQRRPLQGTSNYLRVSQEGVPSKVLPLSHSVQGTASVSLYLGQFGGGGLAKNANGVPSKVPFFFITLKPRVE